MFNVKVFCGMNVMQFEFSSVSSMQEFIYYCLTKCVDENIIIELYRDKDRKGVEDAEAENEQ